MARYSLRDLLGHFTKQPCCDICRHPGFANRLPASEARRATDDELAHYYKAHGSNPRVERVVLREMERRDIRTLNAGHAARRRSDRREARASEIERSWRQAETATNGNMLNKKGRARGIDDRSLFTGSEERARRYASPELLNYWQTHPRPVNLTRAGRDASLVTAYRDLY